MGYSTGRAGYGATRVVIGRVVIGRVAIGRVAIGRVAIDPLSPVRVSA
ncbi:hypothetical protein [Nocardia sp. CC201C]|nr:hypothetical protein [Nocardia sp. CC201C]